MDRNDENETIVVSSEGGDDGISSPFSTIQLNEDQFRAFLRTLSKQKGSMAELARRLDVSGQFIGDVCAGRKRPGKKLLGKLRARSVRVYEIQVESQQ